MKASGEVWSYHSNHSHQEAFMTTLCHPCPKPADCAWPDAWSTNTGRYDEPRHAQSSGRGERGVSVGHEGLLVSVVLW